MNSDEKATSAEPPSLESLLVSHRELVAGIVRSRSRGLLSFEPVDDLAQGVMVEALESRDGFRYRGEAAFRGWLRTVAERHLVHRRRYWRARKRDAGRLLRIVRSGESSVAGPAVYEPAVSQTGPSTFAERRERLRLAVKAISLLLPRDQRIVCAMAEHRSVEELAADLAVTKGAAERARLRAVARFEKLLTALEAPSR